MNLCDIEPGTGLGFDDLYDPGPGPSGGCMVDDNTQPGPSGLCNGGPNMLEDVLEERGIIDPEPQMPVLSPQVTLSSHDTDSNSSPGSGAEVDVVGEPASKKQN